MKEDRSTPPTLPPPLPPDWPPAAGVFAAFSPQQELVSLLDASSKMTASRSPCCYAGESTIWGTQVCRNWSGETSPPGWPSTHGASWPSWQRFGVMKLKLG